MPDSVALDASQLWVADAPAEARLIVTAAAGQGKTEVVLARLTSLNEQGVSIRDDVLVLSFSRAAVETVRRRSEGVGLEDVNIRTFDSFAASVLLDAGEFEHVRGFEARIRRATELIQDGAAEVEDLEHIIVDESQDLVGDRAEMVLALLQAADRAGFTILGDPLQGIYDFQLDDDASRSKRSSAEFLDVLEAEQSAERVALEGHYRAESERMRDLIGVGDQLRELHGRDAYLDEAHELLEEYRLRGGDESPYSRRDIDLLMPYLTDLEPGETTAVLAATNFDVLCLSEDLEERGVPHVVRRRARDAGPARWVGLVLGPLEARKYQRDEFETHAKAIPEAPDDAWRRLKDVEGDRRDHRTIDVLALNRRLRTVSPPLSLTPDDCANVVLSTVHRAKGLEFDHVIDVRPSPGSPSSERTWRSLRQSYVASSRAREDLLVLTDFKRPAGAPSQVDGRWLDQRFAGRGKPMRPSRIEFTNDDVVTTIPAGPTPEMLAEGQGVLATADLLGESVDLRILTQPSGDHLPEYWIVRRDGSVLGQASESFVRALSKQLVWKTRGKPVSWPVQLMGARITSVETAVGDPDFSREAGLGASGFWLVPRLTGLIRPDWTTKTGADA